MSEKPQMKMKWLTLRNLIIAFAVLTGLAMAAIAPGLFWELHKANQALTLFGEALIAKQYDKAYNLTAKELRNVSDYPNFVKAHNDLTNRMGNLRKIHINQSSVKDKSDGWYGTMDAEFIFDRGNLPFAVILKKEDQSWKIYSYHEE
jgi:hypothetical protein